MCVRKLCFLVLAAQCVLSQDSQERESFTIGALFYEDEVQDLQAAFEIGASWYNFNTNIKQIPSRGNIRQVTQKVCELAREKVVGIIDGTGGVASEHVQALADMLELPQVMVKYNDLNTKNWSYINLHPSASAYNKVLQDLIEKKQWNNFTILYVKGHSIERVSELISMTSTADGDRYTISVRELSGDDYRDVLTNAKEHGYFNFVVDCPSENVEQILTHAQEVGLMADEHSYIFVSPDLFTLDLNRFRFGGVNMTGLRLLDLENKDNERLWAFTEKFNNHTGKELNPEDFKTQVLLVYDAVAVFYEGVRKIKGLAPAELSCENYESWTHGSSLLNFMKTTKFDGITRSLAFDGLGERADVSFDVLELTPSGNQTIAQFKNYSLSITRPFLPVNDIEGGSQMRNKTFRVLIATTPPYGYVKESEQQLEGNDRYEGFTIDLIDEIAKILGFNYEFETETDYGKRDEHGKWNGMVLKLMEEKADFAICDFTMTSDRQQAIDFSTPFMTLGVSIMYKKPSKQPPPMFSFMNVFSTEVWLYMMFVQMGIGAIMIFVGRISHKEWQNPVPCIEQPEELSNQFSFANSLWLIIGSVMQQGSEIAPIALAPRLITSVWWFFTMVMVASYVGTLVAFLTVEIDVLPFNDVNDLYLKKGKIAYGAKSGGTTITMFENSDEGSMYNNMFLMMKKNKWIVTSNDIGVEKCETMDYAFFSESTSIEYYTARHCDLIQIGGLLDSKSYGIGMKKGSPYKREIDDALLKLKEKGELQKLKDLWWKEKKGGGNCDEKASEEIKQLGMKNMIGAFVILGAGCLVGIIISILDMLWAVFKRSVKYKTTFKYELVEELKFAIKFSGDIKPVKRPQSSAGSSEALAEALDPEARDELGSLRSAPTVRSGKSTSTSKSTHSHRSRHSSRSLSVAFARRRQYT